MALIRGNSQDTLILLTLALGAMLALALSVRQTFMPRLQSAPVFEKNVVKTVPDMALATYPVEILSVIDGDTVEAKIAIWPDQILQTRVRLLGIDAPELKAKCAREKNKAETSLEALAMMVNAPVRLTNVRHDKYGGRMLGSLILPDGSDVAQQLIALGHARAYTGGRRQGWCEN